MKKIIINIFNILTVTGIILISCSKETVAPEKSNGYKVNIKAVNGSGSTKAINENAGKIVTTFLNTENIYFCNLSDANKIDATPVNPTPDAVDAHDARIVGTLSGETSASVAITYAVGNNLRLLYNTPSNGVVDYTAQNGTFAALVNSATADVTINGLSGNEITASDANFLNLQSIFKLTFKYGETTLNVKYFRITSGGNKLQYQYNAATGTGSYGPVDVYTTSTAPYYVALRFDATPSDPIVFEVVDTDGKVYTGVKNAPATSGFANSKFYTTDISVTPHVFSLSETKAVYFAPGNLVKSGANHLFERAYFSNLGYGSADPATADPTSYFQWSQISSSVNKLTDIPVLFTIAGVSNWKTFGHKEMTYLINSRSMTAGVARYYVVSQSNITSGVGLLLPPDGATTGDVSGLTSGSFTSNINIATYIAKGFVFLPAEGYYRSYWSIIDSPYDKNIFGYYWDCSYYSASGAQFLNFEGTKSSPYYEIVYNSYMENTPYCSVRLYHQ